MCVYLGRVGMSDASFELALSRCCVSKSCLSFASLDVVAMNSVMVLGLLVCMGLFEVNVSV